MEWSGSFKDSAFPGDKYPGRFFDLETLHYTDQKGAHFKVRGPLGVSRSLLQGHPVIVHAVQSDDGRGPAAATADMIFTAHQKLDPAQEFYRDIKARAPGAALFPAASRGTNPKALIARKATPACAAAGCWPKARHSSWGVPKTPTQASFIRLIHM